MNETPTLKQVVLALRELGCSDERIIHALGGVGQKSVEGQQEEGSENVDARA